LPFGHQHFAVFHRPVERLASFSPRTQAAFLTSNVNPNTASTFITVLIVGLPFGPKAA
jgi:hypothetical protein